MINNPLFKCYCHKCLNVFHFSEKIFYLIEKNDYKFFVICESCINEDEYKDTIKKLKMKDIIEHNLFIYEKNKDLDKIKDLETKFLDEKTNLIKNLEILNDYEEKLDLIELISNNIFGSLRKIAEKKINELKKELKIKKLIIDSFYKYQNYIIGSNIISLLVTILDLNKINIFNKI